MGQLTGPLLEISIKPFKAIHFRQNGQLISENRLILEKQKALSRRSAFMQAHKVQAGPDMNYIRKVNTAFSPALPITPDPSHYFHSDSQVEQTYPSAPTADLVSAEQIQSQHGFSEAQAAYVQQRGSFEVRAASGDVTYIPAIQMTIITSWPEVDFTYTGGFHYVPPKAEETEGIGLNLTI